MLVKNMCDDIWVIPMPNPRMLQAINSLHSACPSITTKIYILRCRRSFVSTSTLKKKKDQSLRLVVNYNRVLNKIFEQNRKEVKVGWRKLLDMELHEL
jgi:hypothetical protein